MAVISSKLKRLSHHGARKKSQQLSAGPLLVLFLAICLVIGVWIAGALVFQVTTRTPASYLVLESGQAFPQDPVDFWPLSNDPKLSGQFYPSCLPDDSDFCHRPDEDDKLKVTIQTTPAVTAQAVASQLRDFLQIRPEMEVDIRTFTSQHPEGWIIHVAVLPPLLEAIDLLLEAIEEEDFVPSLRDLEYTLERVLQHHCEFSLSVHTKRAVWSVTLNEVIAFPIATHMSLYEFLEIPEPKREVSASASALAILQRMELVADWFERHPYQHFNHWNQQVINKTHHANGCRLVKSPPSQLTKRVNEALSGSLDCEEHPSIGLCRQHLF